MRFFLSFSLLAVSLFALSAQTPFFQKSIGSTLGESVSDMKQTLDGGYIITALNYTPQYDSSYLRIIRVDSSFNLVWDKQLNLQPNTSANDITVLPSGDFLINGSSINHRTPSPLQGGWVLKLDATGRQLWNRIVRTDGYDYGGQTMIKSDGSLLGLFQNNSETNGTVAVRMSANGTFSDAYTVSRDASKGIRLNQIRPLGSNRFLAAGTAPYVYDKQYIVKFNDNTATPTADWVAEYTLPNHNGFNIIQMQTDEAGRAYIVASLRATGSTEDIVLLAKLSAEGNVMWAKTLKTSVYSSSFAGVGLTIHQSKVAVMGYANQASNGNAFFCQFDTAGTHLWSRRFGANNYEYLHRAIPNRHGGYDVLGTSNYGNSGSDANIYLLRMDSLGQSGGCLTDTLIMNVANATLNKTATSVSFPILNVTVQNDTLKNYFHAPLSSKTTCGAIACTPPAAPQPLYGTQPCSNSIGVDSMPTLRWSRTASLYNVVVYEMGYANAVWSANCVTDTFVRPSFDMRATSLYRWQVTALKGSCNAIECQSDTSVSGYFHRRFTIFERDTAVNCPSSSVTFNAPFAATFTWYRNNQVIPDIYSSFYQTDQAGVYHATTSFATNWANCRTAKIESHAAVIKTDSAFPFVVRPSATTFCPNQTIKLTASGSPSRVYNWSGDRLFANTINTGDSVATVVFPNNASGVYKFFINALHRQCYQERQISLTISPSAPPSVSVVMTGCPSRNLTLTANPTNAGTNPEFVWYRNKDTTPIGTGKVLTFNNAQNNDKFTCRIKVNDGSCSAILQAVSDTTTITCINTGTNDIEGLNRFEVSPNPSNGHINLVIETKKAFTQGKCTIFNALGQTIYQEKWLDNLLQISKVVDLTNQTKGIYWLQIQIDNQTAVRRVVIE